jgi:hypothetical protein
MPSTWLSAEELEAIRGMVRFAVTRGIAIPPDAVRAIAEYELALNGGTLTNKTTEDLVSATQSISRAISPATSEGIKFCTAQNRRSPAMRMARLYNNVAIIVFVLLVFAQGYWVLLNEHLKILHDTQEELNSYVIMIDALDAGARAQKGRETTDEELTQLLAPVYAQNAEKRRAAFEKPDNTTAASPNSATDKVFQRYLTHTRFNYLKNYQAIIVGQITGLVPQRAMFGAEHHAIDSGWWYLFNMTAEDVRTLQAAQTTIQFMSQYLLPILFGLLGASIYIVRRANTEIQNASLTERIRTDFRIRFFLGGVSGLAVSWFLPVAGTPGANVGMTALTNLSPLVLSFLAGYAIEIVFATIDRIIAGFRDNESSRSRHPI